MACRNIAAVALATVFVSVVPVPVDGQAPAHTWNVPRTGDGHPDLQGYWTNATFTPLERPPELAGKEFMTDAEAAAFEKPEAPAGGGPSQRRHPLRQCDLAERRLREDSLEDENLPDLRSTGWQNSSADSRGGAARRSDTQEFR